MIRTLLVLACFAFFALCLVGMRRGWLHRVQRQADLPALPAAPADLGAPLLAPMTGLYVGTTAAGQWQDRVAARGLGVRAQAVGTLHRAGLLIERTGADAVFIPAQAVVSAGVGAGLAGKVMGPGGLLIVRWQHGSTELDTGLRADDRAVYPAWVEAIDEMKVLS